MFCDFSVLLASCVSTYFSITLSCDIVVRFLEIYTEMQSSHIVCSIGFQA